MSFLRFDETLLNVPGKLDPDEMAFLAALAARVPSGGQIVEIGPFYGRSTRVMGLANPKAKITSIDTFEDVEWTQRYAARHPKIPAFGEEAFAQFTHDLPNSTAIKGPSPDVARDWSAPIDMYFEDAVHGNPILAKNLTFWTSHLKPGGIACGHDYTLRFPDIKREVDALAARWQTKISIVGSLWALRKPSEQGALTAALTPALTNEPRLKLHAKNKRNGLHKSPDGYWCGAHLDADRLLWFQIRPQGLPPGVRLEARLGHPEHGVSAWLPTETPLRLTTDGNKPLPFDRIALRLTGPSAGLSVGYKVSARQIGRGGSVRSGISNRVYNGAWAQVPDSELALNALTVGLYSERPPDAQMAFPEVGLGVIGQKILRRLVRKLAPAHRDTPRARQDAT